MSDQPDLQASVEAHAADGALEHGASVGGAIERLTGWLALVGGALLLFTIGITLVSVAGRYLLGKPVPGDYELVELTCGVAIFLFFPYTHATGANISALFFTSGLPLRLQRGLDLVHDVVFALVAAMLTWRLTAGLLEKYAAGESSMLIRIPLWWAFSFAVASMALLTIVCLARIAVGFKALRR
jgi:TRAP-type C4-dicarboxylate transport system permease small subunit